MCIVYAQHIDLSVKMFDELLVKNPHVKKMCEHYQVDIDGCHCTLIKDMIRGKQKEPSDDSSDEEAGEKPKRKQSSIEKAFLLEVRIILLQMYVFMYIFKILAGIDEINGLFAPVLLLTDCEKQMEWI